MAKPFLEDMVRVKRSRTAGGSMLPPKISSKVPTEVPRVMGNRPRYLLWSVAAISAAFLLLAVSFVFARAEVAVFPKTESLTLNENLSAEKNVSNGEVSFDLVVMPGQKSKNLEASEEEEVVERATGQVVIFNAYSSVPQRLDVDTRLSGSNDKLYKTKTKTTVPGMKPDGTPGSVEVDIYAAEAGAEYNSGPLDFQIVGFKGTPKYEKFKVRSQAGTEISGGFRGKTLVVSEEEKAKALDELKTALRVDLFKKASGEIPDGFILFPDATAFTVDKVDFPLGETELIATLSGTLYGLLFSEENLTKKIAERKVAGYAGEDVYIPNIQDLKFTLTGAPGAMLEDLTRVSFNLSGPAQIIWKLDAEKFAADLLGRPKKDFVDILSQYKNIDRAELTLSPIWQKNIPDQAGKIKIHVNYPR